MGFEDCPGAHVLSHDFWEFRMSWHLKTLVGWADRVWEPLLASLVGPARLLAVARVAAVVVWMHCTRAGCPGHCGGCRRRLDALHEGGVPLDEGWGYFG